MLGHTAILQQNVLRGRALQHTLVVVSRDEFMSGGSLKNKSIVKATSGLVAYDWRGPVIALAKKGTEFDPSCPDDITMHDFRDLIDHFSTYDAGVSMDGKLSTIMRVNGVRINCRGHMEALKMAKYSTVEVSTQDPVFREPPELCPFALGSAFLSVSSAFRQMRHGEAKDRRQTTRICQALRSGELRPPTGPLMVIVL